MRKCTIEGCNNKYHAKGLCQHHKNKMDRHGDPLWEKNNISDIKTYGVWINMKVRCKNSKNPEYKNYGGRGITVCDRWLHSFENFYEDMGDKPFPKAQIDRIDNNGNYEPNNCRWVTFAENNRNKRTTIINMNIAEQIREIRKTTNLSYPKIANKFNIKTNIVVDVCLNRSWLKL